MNFTFWGASGSSDSEQFAVIHHSRARKHPMRRVSALSDSPSRICLQAENLVFRLVSGSFVNEPKAQFQPSKPVDLEFAAKNQGMDS